MTKNETELQFYIVLENFAYQLPLKIFPVVSDHFLLLRFFLCKNGLRQPKHLFETLFFFRRYLIVSLFISVYL